MKTPLPSITLDSLDLEAAERLLCVKALETSGSIVEAAKILGVTRHALKRRIIKHKIEWPPPHSLRKGAQGPGGSDSEG